MDSLDPEPLRQAYAIPGHGPRTVNEMIGIFRMHSSWLIARMRRAVETGNEAELQVALHGLRSSAATIGATHLAYLCTELMLAVQANADAALDATNRLLVITQEHTRVITALDDFLQRMRGV